MDLGCNGSVPTSVGVVYVRRAAHSLERMNGEATVLLVNAEL